MFQGLSTALTALYADRQALETTGNNIANANTEGYSRESVMLDPMGGETIPSFWGSTTKVGTGVSIQDITRMRDAFLDMQSLTAHSAQGQLNTAKNTMNQVQQTFQEPNDNGIQEQMAAFWSSWDDLANNPGDLATRSQVLEQAQTLAGSFQQASASLTQYSAASVTALKNDVSQLNAWAQNVGDLNTAIQAAMNAGTSPNALLDQRDLLVSKMSDLAGVTVQPTQNGSVAVSIGGMPIVRDDRVTNLEVDDTGSPPVLRWDKDKDPTTVNEGPVANVTGGEIQGLMDTVSTTLPKYQTLINNVASNLITTVNTQHTSGVDQNGNPGGVFFTGTDASTIAVDPTLAADPTLLAAAQAGGGALDGENARTMANLASSTTGPDVTYRQMIDTLGVESQRAINQSNIQNTITNNIDGSRQSVSGVNLDEEMTNMVRFQNSYNAAAKYMGVMDNVLQTLINMVQ